jgi:hypothetical protein
MVEKRRVLVEDRTGRKQHRTVREDTLRKNYQRVPRRGRESFYGKKVPVRTKRGIERRYISPRRQLTHYEYEEGAFQKRKRDIEPEPGEIPVRLVVVYGIVRKPFERDYLPIGEWYWYLDSDLPDDEIVGPILQVVEEESGGHLYRLGANDRVSVGIQRFEAKRGPITVDLDTLLTQLRERIKGTSWRPER